MDPRIESILLTPICTHSLFARSLIFESSAEICVEIPQDGEDIYISCDGDASVRVEPGSTLIVKRAQKGRSSASSRIPLLTYSTANFRKGGHDLEKETPCADSTACANT